MVTEFTSWGPSLCHFPTDGVGGLFLVAAALLVVSGLAKLRSIEPTRKHLHAAALPGPTCPPVGAVRAAVAGPAARLAHDRCRSRLRAAAPAPAAPRPHGGGHGGRSAAGHPRYRRPAG